MGELYCTKTELLWAVGKRDGGGLIDVIQWEWEIGCLSELLLMRLQARQNFRRLRRLRLLRLFRKERGEKVRRWLGWGMQCWTQRACCSVQRADGKRTGASASESASEHQETGKRGRDYYYYYYYYGKQTPEQPDPIHFFLNAE